ncbi:MAG TPA: CHAT domain-containing protein [Planctomycetaceae bacterium]|nr:CHAT domain-containing protein [Planctomycetaceae bacterium]
MPTLHITQDAPRDGKYAIRLRLNQDGQPERTAEATIEFALTEQEQGDLRWYLEDYLLRADVVPAGTVQQVEAMMKSRGEELYDKVLAANRSAQNLWGAIRDQLADLRVEVASGIAEAASIPWELMRDPETDSPISLRVQSFVRVQSNPNISFVRVKPGDDGRIRLLYIACRPGGARDVPLRAVANTLLTDLGPNRARFDIKALRPPSFEQLQKELADAKKSRRPFQIVHFDGHGMYADLSKTQFADWAKLLSIHMLGAPKSGKHGYLMFEDPGKEKPRPVDGQTLGQLLHDNDVPVLVLNACQSAMHEAVEAPKAIEGVHDQVRAIGSLSQAVIDQGIPAVLGMRYSVYVVTAAQYIGQLYAALADGGTFGQAATQGRRHLQLNPDRWLGLEPRPLQDWFVPVAYEAGPIELLPVGRAAALSNQSELDPVQSNRALLRYVPDKGFVGRDETLLALDRAFDNHPVVLLHAYAGQGKSSTAVEFARWYSLTGGLGDQPIVLLASFESHRDLNDLLSQVGQPFAAALEQQGIHWGAVNDPEERRRLVLRILRSVPILWIWDNVEPVAGFPEGTKSQWTDAEQNDLRDFLKQIQLDNACQVKILLTSRRDEKNWLGEIPHRIPMRRMSNADAASLALKLGEGRGLNRAEIADWQPLLDYCAGNPLTLRVLVGQAVREGKRGRQQIAEFVEAIRSGETEIKDADEKQGRDKSLGASLEYGFRNAFPPGELPIVALLHLFQGVVDVDALAFMGKGEHALPEVTGKTKEQLTSLLERATETGLLTHLGSTWFTIHPALPWFLRQLFLRHYDGQDGRSRAQAALRAWVEAVGALGDFYLSKANEGAGGVFKALELEEDNLLHARRLARRYQWSSRLISCMQGLTPLYVRQGRWAELARLVEEIVPDYCSPDDGPIEGRQGHYTVVMGYRVSLAQFFDRDVAKAAALQQKRLEWNRRRADSVLALPADAPLDDRQRNSLDTLAASFLKMGQLLLEVSDAECVTHFNEAIRIFQRIGAKAGQAIAEFNLAHAYKDIASIRDLDAAEAAYRRSLDMFDENDASRRSKCMQQIGMVHQERFDEARERGEAAEILLGHWEAAHKYLLQALQLCPDNALPDLGPMHNQLGILYKDAGQANHAREQFEEAVQCYEKAGDRLSAGKTRENIALMYLQAPATGTDSSTIEANLRRARDYEEAALRDFQHFQGRVAKQETKANRILEQINEALVNIDRESRNGTGDAAG